MFLLRLISRLPFFALYLISDFLFFITYRLVRYRRKLVRKNLTRAFPEKSLPEIIRIEKQFYRNLCDYGVETLKLLSISPQEMAIRMDYAGNEELTAHILEGQSAIVLASHTFNWEWVLVSGSIGRPLDFVYQKLSSSFFNRFSILCRTRFGAYPIERERVGREFILRKNKVRVIANVADQFPGLGRDKRFYATFLNQKTAFFHGINGMAQAMQYPVYYVNSIKLKRGFFKTEFTLLGKPPFGSDDHRVINRYVEELEKSIQKQPDNWLWSHNRWKVR